MACSGDKAPIELDTSYKSNKCDVTCRFQFSYGTSTCKVTPQGDFLEYKYDGITNVTFNATDDTSKYTVDHIRIYAPPLTQYTIGGASSAAVAEMFIYHTNQMTGENLLLCIPIAEGGGVSRSSQTFSSIIAPTIENNGEEQSINAPNFSLDAFVPLTDFYQYKGNVPYSATGGSTCVYKTANIIVFPADGKVNMSSDTLSVLKSLVTPVSVGTHQTSEAVKLRYNESGTTNNEGAVGDDIYIECNPVDDDGNVVPLDEAMNAAAEGKKISVSPADKKRMQTVEAVLYGAGGLLVGLALIYLIRRAVRKYLLSDN